MKQNCAKNASKFKEIYLNSLAFSLQTSFINFRFLQKNEATTKSLFWILVNQSAQSDFKYYRRFAHFEF